MPASLTAVLERIGAIQARFGAAGASSFSDILSQVSDAGSATADGTVSTGTADLASLPESERQLIVKEAKREGVDPALALAVVLRESGGNPQAVSSAGAMGLMQLMPQTAQELGVTNPFDPAQNLAGGLDYLRQKLNEFGSVPLALAAYNAGSGAVSQWGGVPPYPQTQAYVAGVLSARDQIARALVDGKGTGATAPNAGQRAPGGAAGTAPASTRTAPPATVGPAGSGSSPSRGGSRGTPAAAPASSPVEKPASPGPDHTDGSLHGMVVRQWSDAVQALGRPGDSATASDGRSGPAAASTGDGSVAAPQARSADAVMTAGSVQRSSDAASAAASARDGSVAAPQARSADAVVTAGSARRGSDTATAAGLGVLLHQSSGQAQGAGNQGVALGGGQTPQQGDASTSSAPSSQESSAVGSGSLLRSPDGVPVAPAGGTISHVTVRSGGDMPVTVSLTDRAETVSGRVTTSTPGMAQTLQDHVGSLRAALASHQVNLSDLAVRPATSDRPSNGQQGTAPRTPRPAQAFTMSTADSEEDAT